MLPAGHVVKNHCNMTQQTTLGKGAIALCHVPKLSHYVEPLASCLYDVSSVCGGFQFAIELVLYWWAFSQSQSDEGETYTK